MKNIEFGRVGIPPINADHYLVKDIKERLSHNTLYDIFNGDRNQLVLVTNILGQLREKLEIKEKPRISDNLVQKESGTQLQNTDFLNYHQVTINSAEQRVGSDVGFIMLPGIFGNAASNIVEPKTFWERANKQTKFTVGFATALSSSAGLDTLGTPFNVDMPRRAVAQAMLILDVIQKTPVKELYICAHSNAGREAAQIIAAVQIGLDLLKLSSKTKIGGVILSAPAGHFDHTIKDVPYMVQRQIRAFSMHDEVDQLFPQARVFADIQQEIKRLEDLKTPTREDRIKREQLKRQFSWMVKTNAEALRLLTEEQFAQLQKIDEVLPKLQGKKAEKKVHERYRLLTPIISSLTQGADMRSTNLKQLVSIYKNVIAITVPDAFRVLPQTERDLIDYPVCFYYSQEDKDAYFASEVAYSRMNAWETREWIQLKDKIPRGERGAEFRKTSNFYVRKSPLVILAHSNVSHIAAVTDPNRYMVDIFHLVKKMYDFNHLPKNERPNVQVVEERTY